MIKCEKNSARIQNLIKILGSIYYFLVKLNDLISNDIKKIIIPMMPY